MVLDPEWTLYDPLGDCTVDQIAGELSFVIPAVAHVNTDVPRVLQTCANVDFTIQTKINSQPTVNEQGLGVIVEQDHDNHLQFYVTYDGSYRVIIKQISAGVPTVLLNQVITPAWPQWLFVERTGNDFTVSTSDDGIVFVEAGTVTVTLTVATAGLFALTSGPAWEGLFDDFIADGILPEEPGSIIETIELQDYITGVVHYYDGITESITLTDTINVTIIPANTVQFYYVGWIDESYYAEWTENLFYVET